MSSQTAVVGNSLLGRPSGELALRVSAPSSASRTVRLAGGKCTIGSSRNCTLRLRAAGVSPVHCLIVRGEHATVVRRWSADTLLNGRPFTDAELTPGDRLSVGSIEMDVVELGTGQELSRLATDTLNRLRQSGTVDGAHSDETSHALEQSLRFLQVEQELAARAEQLAAQCQELETSKRELAEREEAWTREISLVRADHDHQQQALLAQRESLQQLRSSQIEEHDQARRELDELRQQMENERAELQQKQADHWAELARVRRQLDDERQQFTTERTEKQHGESGALAELAAREEQLKTTAAELEKARAEFQAEQKELADEEGEFNEWRARAAEAADDLARQHDALSRERRQLSNRHQQFDKLQAEIREELDAERAELEQQRLELQVHVAALAEQRKATEDHACKAEADINAKRQELIGAQQELERQSAQSREELAIERSAIEHQREELKADLLLLAEQRKSVEDLAASLAAERQQLAERQVQSNEGFEADRRELDRQRQDLQMELAAISELQRAVENKQVQARETIEAEWKLLRDEQNAWRQQREEEQQSSEEQPARAESCSQGVEQQRIADEQRAAERQAWEARIASLTAEIDQLQKLSAEENARLAGEREALRQEHEQIAQRQSELTAEQSRFDEQRAEWDQSQATACDNLILARNMLAEHQTSLEIERRNWETERHAFEMQRQQFEVERQTYEVERAAHAVEVQACTKHEPGQSDGAKNGETTAHDEADNVAQAREQHASDVLTTEPALASHSHSAPADDWRSKVDWANESPEEEAAELPQRQADLSPAAQVSATPNRRTDERAESGEEESIEEYMAKLMRRVRGESDASSATYSPMPAATARRASQPESRHERQARVQVDEPVVSQEPTEPFQLVPRNKPPELSSNLGAMRELANWSAKQAIDTSVRQRWNRAAIGKLAVAITGLVVGTSLLQWSQEFSDVPFMAAMLAYVITVFWLLQGGLIFRNIRKANKLEQDASHTDEAHDAAASDTEADIVDDDRLATPDEFATDYWAEDEGDARTDTIEVSDAAEFPGTVEVVVDEAHPEALGETEPTDGESEK